MNESKCRLCLCLVDKKMSFFCSLNDDSFRTMVKTVFPFPVPVDHTVASKTYSLPVLVCFLCSTTVRNFYSFSKLAEANQQTLQTECSSQDATVSVNNLIEYIKADPGVEFEESDYVLRLPADTEAADNVNGLNSSTAEPLGEHSSDPLGATTHVIDHGYTRKDELVEHSICLETAGNVSLARPVTSEGSKHKWDQRKSLLFSQKVALRLIKAVKARPCIWMVRDKTYKNMKAKDLAWSAISSELGGSVVDVKKKWRNLTIQFYNNRKTYVMNKRNGTGAVKPSWYAYEALEFMEQVPARPIRVGAVHQTHGKRVHHKHQTNVKPESDEDVEKAEFRTHDSESANGRPGNPSLFKNQ